MLTHAVVLLAGAVPPKARESDSKLDEEDNVSQEDFSESDDEGTEGYKKGELSMAWVWLAVLVFSCMEYTLVFFICACFIDGCLFACLTGFWVRHAPVPFGLIQNFLFSSILKFFLIL